MKSSSGKKPNLIYVFADQLRLKSCGYAGDADAVTPNIDALAGQGIDFINAVSGHPVCAPYRASLFTGKYTTGTGMVINELRMNTGHRCIGHVLTEAGYDTAYIGKWHLWANQMGNHNDPVNSFVPPGPDRLGFDGYWAAYNFHHVYYDTYYHLDSPEKIPTEGYEPDFQTDLAIRYIQEKAESGEPFALFLSFGTPHDPWNNENVPEEYYSIFRDKEFNLPQNYIDGNDSHADSWARLEREERRDLGEWMKVYYAMTTNLDHNIGRLMKAVDNMNIGNDTIFVFTSDHGEMFGAHGRRAKNIFYDEAVRVPFLVRWPGKIAGGTKTGACINSCDIMPTLLSIMGLPIPGSVQGSDYSECIWGNPDLESDFAFMQGTGATAAWEDGHEWRAVRDKQYTYAVYKNDGEEFLFDNINDPHQLVNLCKDNAYNGVLERLRMAMHSEMERIGDTFERSTWYRDHWTNNRIITKIP